MKLQKLYQVNPFRNISFIFVVGPQVRKPPPPKAFLHCPCSAVIQLREQTAPFHSQANRTSELHNPSCERETRLSQASGKAGLITRAPPEMAKALRNKDLRVSRQKLAREPAQSLTDCSDSKEVNPFKVHRSWGSLLRRCQTVTIPQFEGLCQNPGDGAVPTNRNDEMPAS